MIHPTDHIAGVSRFSGYVDFWDTSSGAWTKQINLGYGRDYSYPDLEYINDGEYLVIAPGNDNFIQIWNPITFQLLSRNIYASNGIFMGDNAILVSELNNSVMYYIGNEGLHSYNFDLSYWKIAACDKINRNLTIDEWNTYLSGYEYHKTCEQYPAGTPE